MSRFLCICGKATRADEEPRDASGVLYSIADLQEDEARITKLVGEFIVAADRQAWVRTNLDSPYPLDVNDREQIADIVSRELNANFTSVFRCPHCNCIAMKGSEEIGWRFFVAGQPAG